MLKIWTLITNVAYAYSMCLLVRFFMQWIDPGAKSPLSRILSAITNPVTDRIGSKAVVNGTNFAPIAGFFIVNIAVYILTMLLLMIPSSAR